MFQDVNESQPINLYLPHGDPSGLAMASTEAYPVKVFRVPRQMLHDYELGVGPKDNGVFFLVGDDEGGRACYIASGHDLPGRIEARDVDSSRWQTVFYAVSGSSPWTQTEALYIGHYCAAQVAKSGHYGLQGPATGVESTPAPELAVRCGRLAGAIAELMRTLGCTAMEEAPSEGAVPDDLFYLRSRQSSARARIASDGSVTVLAGSSGLAETTHSVAGSITRYREKLIDGGSAEVQGDRLALLIDHRFESLSTAAAVITGRNINGHKVWRSVDGETPRELGILTPVV